MPGAPDDVTAAATLLLGRIGRLHEAFVQERCARLDLTSADFRVLAFLHLHGADRAASPTLIGSWIVQTSGGLTATLRRLTGRGLIERRVDPSDGRGKLVAITPEGQDTYRRLFTDLVDRFARLTTNVDLGALFDVLGPLLVAYEEADRRPRSASWDGLTNLLSPTELIEEYT